MLQFCRTHEATSPMTFPSLPCFPCPHNASCCAFGTTLDEHEALAIEAEHGSGLVYQTRWGEWRTRVRNRRCVMFANGHCTIHDKPYYPTQCQGFPWTDGVTGSRYEFDLTICGEFVRRPDLITIQRSLGHESRQLTSIPTSTHPDTQRVASGDTA